MYRDKTPEIDSVDVLLKQIFQVYQDNLPVPEQTKSQLFEKAEGSCPARFRSKRRNLLAREKSGQITAPKPM